MSTCISRKGEFGSHTTTDGNYICEDCGVLDEDGIFGELEELRSKVANTPDAPRDATETDEASRTVFRDRGEIIAALTARNAELEAEVERLGNEVAHRWTSAAVSYLITERDSARDEVGRLSDLLIGRADAAGAEVERLRSALERTEGNLRLAVNGKPVRDMTETLAENRAALASTGRAT